MSTPQYEIAPEQLNAEHLGMRAFFQWEDPNIYKVGTIVGVAADSTAIHVNLAGIDQGVVFLTTANDRWNRESAPVLVVGLRAPVPGCATRFVRNTASALR